MKCLLALLRALFAFHSHNFALQPTNTRVTVFPKHYEPPSTFLTSATQVSAVHARVLRHQSSSAPDLQRPRLESALAFNCSSPSVSTSRSLDGVAFRCRNGCRNKSDDVWKTPCQCLCQPASSFWYCGVRFSAVRMRRVGVAVSITVVHPLHHDARARALTCTQAQAQRRGRSCDSREVMTHNASAKYSNTDEPILLMTPNTHV